MHAADTSTSPAYSCLRTIVRRVIPWPMTSARSKHSTCSPDRVRISELLRRSKTRDWLPASRNSALSRSMFRIEPRPGSNLPVVLRPHYFLSGCGGCQPGRHAISGASPVPQSWIGRLLQSLADQIVGQHGEEDRQPRKHESATTSDRFVRPALSKRPPTGIRRGRPETEEAQCAFRQNGIRDSERNGHEDRGQRVRQDVAQDDPQFPDPGRPCRRDKIHFLQSQEFAACQPRDARPSCGADDGHDVPDRRFLHDRQQCQESTPAPECRARVPPDGSACDVDPAAEITRQRPHTDSDERGDPH